MYNSADVTTLNFAVVGSWRSGIGLLGAMLNQEPGVICHRHIVSDDPKLYPEEVNRQRKQHHRSYFNPEEPVDYSVFIDWFHPAHISLYRYLSEKIFDNPQRQETHIGAVIPYSLWLEHDLTEYAQEWRQRVCWLHVVRNPVACFLSLQRYLRCNGTDSQVASGAFLDAEELVTFVRDWAVVNRQVERNCSDRLVLPFHELLLSYHKVHHAVWQFLDLPQGSCYGFPDSKTYRPMSTTNILNLKQLQRSLPSDVVSFLKADDFI